MSNSWVTIYKNRAEACAVVVLKRFEDAWRDGDNILAVVKGSAVNNDGAGTSFGTPNEKAQEQVYRSALKCAQVNAADVSFIETHGTGTIVGKLNCINIGININLNSKYYASIFTTY